MDVSRNIEPTVGFRSKIVQVVICILCNTALLSSGMTLGFSGVALPEMLSPNDLLHINSEQASWIASIAAMVTPIGCLLSGPIIDRLGRRTGLALLNIPALLGWIIIVALPTYSWHLVGRVLTGIACGLSSTPATVYVAESSTTTLRGFLVTGASISISAGISLVYMFGLIFKSNWRIIATMCGIFPLISIGLIFWFVPESPVWLMAKGKYDQACSSLYTLRATTDLLEIQDELEELAHRTQERQRADNTSYKAILQFFLRPEAYKPFIIMNIFFLFQQLSGIFVVIVYAVDVVTEAGVTIDPYVVAVLIGLTRLCFTFVSGWMSKRLGRRICAISSGIGMAASLLVLAYDLYSRPSLTEETLYVLPPSNSTNTPDNNDNVRVLPVIMILFYILTSTIGFMTLPWAMIGEVYPVQIRGIAGGLTTCIAYIVSFITLKSYPSMMEAFHKHGVFFIYGIMSVAGTVFVTIFLPETQGKTLIEIEQYFAGKRKRTTEDEDSLHQSTKLVPIIRRPIVRSPST